MRRRAQQRVIIGPWTHTDFSGSFPDRDFGPAASATAIDLSGIQLRWFDRWLRGADNGIDAEPAVNRILHDQDHPSRLILPIIER
jgi:uncharacterized protein